ncbi:tetratricopeptide repeat protein [Chlorobium phaeobacteroides]|jgi:tetratricopeptide (TPR) repeat protein|uniref:Tetratricopeptide TPR_2 repeat protein n=1 Tax=Chlorobium phaeobacteroides (strain DSM 266 / SMG 266 / 2430) TaxID=290317 RepID=A1BH07_CHLPD|nr:hypothetical protein [Chlorobium phaeobacteroides]ABL65684.1 conserved hypothetical protein [Chlorobium phaeobacteroides DSM 266]
MMSSDPSLFYADVSLDLAKGEYQSAQNKIVPFLERFADAYLLNLFYARALRGLKNNNLAADYFHRCCRLAPTNDIARKELIDLQTALPGLKDNQSEASVDLLSEELEQLMAALIAFEPAKTTESFDPTPVQEQKQPFPDDAVIALPTESLADLFSQQGAYKKAIKVYTSLIQLKPNNAENYKNRINELLEKL